MDPASELHRQRIARSGELYDAAPSPPHPSVREHVYALADELLKDGVTKVYFADMLSIGGTIACTTAEVKKLGISGDPGITLTELSKTHPDAALRAARMLAAKRVQALPVEALQQKPRGACQHLGPVSGERVDCPSCSGKVALKVLTCAVHGKCLPQRQVPGVPYCGTCKDYAAIANK
jgi:hypothetical protein